MRKTITTFYKGVKLSEYFQSQNKILPSQNAKGEFIEPFDYATAGGLGAREAYGENNGWIYRWDVPHNIAGFN